MTLSFLQQLPSDDQALARGCLGFIVDSHRLDREFATRMGVTEREAADILARWPAVDDVADDSPACLAINNALNEVANGLSLSAAEWDRLGTDHLSVAAVLRRYSSLRGWQSTGLR